MNQLNRIVLINSAKVDFHEIQLDGNIHFIGTQGTGKSTLLRAILFFYNADTRKLGISKEKLPFADYYFPNTDSYIIYEVRQAERNFCVWLYKKLNRLCLRFIDGPYSRELFIQNHQALAETEIIAKANGLGYKVQRPIFNYSEYRDIIYGANKGMSRFQLLHNPAYQNIPRTISNIFLNSSLDGGFIKTTIINSLSDEQFELNLDTEKHHIETARSGYQDVNEFLKHEKRAHNIVEFYDQLLSMEQEQKKIAWEIGAAYNQAREQERLSKDSFAVVAEQLKNQQDKITKIDADHRTGQSRVQNKLSVVIADIKKANRLAKEYAAQNIELVLAENDKKADYVAGLAQANAQLELLTANLKDVESQFQNEKQRLENQCQLQIIDFKNSKATESQQIQDKIAALNRNFYQHKEQLTKEYNQEKEKLNLQKTELEKRIAEVQFKIENISQKQFLEEELKALQQKRQEFEKLKVKSKARKKLAESTLISTQKEGENKVELLETKGSQQREDFKRQKKALELQIEQINTELQALSGSLVEFLDSNHPAWGQSIGKIVSKEILLHNNLNPTLSDGNNCYGLNLNLENLDPIRLSKTDLENKLAPLQQQLAEQNKAIEKQLIDLQDQKDKLQKKYNKQILDLKQEEKECTLEVEKSETGIEKIGLDINLLKEKAALQKQEAQKQEEARKHQLEVDKKEISELLSNRDEQHHKIVSNLQANTNAEEKKLKAKLMELVEQINITEARIKQEFQKQINELEAKRNKLLEEKGIDTTEIKSLEEKAKTWKAKLDKIEKNLQLVFNYQKDCKDYIDRLAEFQQARKELEANLEHAANLFANRMEKEQAILADFSKQRDELKMRLAGLTRELEAFKLFSQSQTFEELRNFVEHHDRADHWKCDENIRKLTNLALDYEKKQHTLTAKITEFAGYFNPNNCLGFETNLSGNKQFRAFAGNLKEFVREQKIVDYKTEVTRKYAMVLANIVNETNELLRKEEDVQKVIHRINADFRKSNFVGVVKSIEMRIQESSNKLIQMLRKIRNFQAENHLNYGEINLFNQDQAGSNDTEAVKLLENLLQQIGQAKSKAIRLEDAFDLEFRIRENENDTNWVSRLANVGSNGTDVLVKSMIYINLLHIFKTNGSKAQTDAMLHCLIDEVGILHDSNVTGLISFAGERNIRLINGSPNSHNEQDYRHIYMFRKNRQSNKTGITKLISHEL
ncbi:ATP-binding protein [Mangrovibacterium marinum]|uniref:Uncharacterized protein DUF3584 n=1 Tax=Mangrovibacterium marinum TaxID=1639118 RepID=A0A2T5C3E6_9BACT|nr:ATP-binding protein [Mangrovibacterium marinum]PTN09287.1 uncharacterized protein DUF3584 [Mangrovibacterium marinum]